MDFSLLSDFLSSAGFGAIAGGFFGWLSRKEEREKTKIQNKHEIDMLEHTTQRDLLLAEKAIERKEVDAFVESQKATGGFSDVIKGMVRPLITAVLLFITYDIYQALDKLTGGVAALPADQQYLLYKMLIQNIITLTATAVSWWFASRSSSHLEFRWKK